MKKYLPVLILLLLLLIGGGAFLTFKSKPAQQTATNTQKVNHPNIPVNVFTSIKDALSKSLSLECDYKDNKGNESKTHIKSGAVRVEALTAKGTNSQVIIKDKKMYSWDPETKKGVVFEISDVTPSVNSANQNGAAENENKQQSILDEIEKYKNSCRPATVSDSLFIPPTDVEFQDLNKLMQQVPSSGSNNGAPPSFDIEKLKKQYAPTGE